MDITAKYCRAEEQAEPGNKEKIVLSDDAYAVIEMLNEVAFRLGRLKHG